jgi:hypothetical protein
MNRLRLFGLLAAVAAAVIAGFGLDWSKFWLLGAFIMAALLWSVLKRAKPEPAFTVLVLGAFVVAALVLAVLNEAMNVLPFTVLVLGAFFVTALLLSVLKRWLLHSERRPLSAKRDGLRWLGGMAALMNLFLLIYSGLLLTFIMGMELLRWALDIPSRFSFSFVIDVAALVIMLFILFWSYFSMATPIATALWLRRFHIDAVGFDVAKAFDHLSISGLRVLTLADSKVAASRLSSRQCYIKLAVDLLAYLIVPIAIIGAICALWVNAVLFNPEVHKPPPFVRSEYFLLGVLLIGGLCMLYGLWRLVANMRRTIILGTGAVRLDAAGVKRFIAAENRRVRSGGGDNFFAGKAVLRIGDAQWEAAVKSAIKNVDFIIFDATQFWGCPGGC